MEKRTADEKIINNMGLVYYIALKYARPLNEDLVSCGFIGLVKAARTFDESRGTKFATYAATCITNEINMFYRIENKNPPIISLSEVLKEQSDGSKLYIQDVLPSTNSSLMQDYEEGVEFIEIINVILNVFNYRDIYILLNWISKNKTQSQIADELNLAQSYISRLYHGAIKKLKKVISLPYDKTIEMSLENGMYSFKFTVDNSVKFVPILLDYLINSTAPAFLSSCKDKSFCIKVFAFPENLEFIADVIKQMHEMDENFKGIGSKKKINI